MTTKHLPYSPLTHRELNKRVLDLDRDIASVVAISTTADDLRAEWTVARLLELAGKRNGYQRAAEARCDRSAVAS